MRGVEDNLARRSLALAAQANLSIQSLSLVLSSISERVAHEGIIDQGKLKASITGADIRDLLKEKLIGLPQIEALGLVDFDGNLVNSTRVSSPAQIKVDDRDFFQAFKADPGLAMYVSGPFQNRANGNWNIVVAVQMYDPNGEPIGLLTGSINLEYFESYWRSILSKDEVGSSISLNRLDGTVLARFPRTSAVGKKFKDGVQTHFRDSNAVILRKLSPIDHAVRIESANILQNYPLFVLATQSESSALQGWFATAKLITVISVGCVLVVLVAAYGMWRWLREHECRVRMQSEKLEAEKARVIVEAELQRNRESEIQGLRLHAAIENMSQGLLMFDASERLVVVNQRYIDMLGVSPDVIKPGCTYRDLLAHRKATGNFLEDVDEYHARIVGNIAKGKATQHLTETPDGRSIKIANSPMADGGWVATLEDVTETKRLEKSFQLLFKDNPVPMWVFDPVSLHFLAVNDAALVHYGYSREQFLTMTTVDIRPPEERERFKQLVRIHGGTHNGEQTWRHQKSDGTRIDVSIFSRKLNYEGHPAIVVAAIDTTDRMRAEEELRRTRKFLDTVIEHIPVAITVKDARDDRYTLVNRAWEDLFGISRKEIIGKTTRGFHPKERADFLAARNSEALQSDRVVFIPDHSLVTPSNGTRLITAKKLAIRGDDGTAQHLLTVIDDVTDRRQSEARIAHMAHYDSLTDLPNRASFNSALDTAFDRAAKSGEQFTVLSLDLDYFKDANDTYGHMVGDALLWEAASRLRAAAKGAFLARVGGDEFALIVTEGAQPEAARVFANRMLAAFEDDFTIESRRLRLGLSIGGAVYPADGADAKTLMINADTALYRAKAETRGTLRLFEPEMDKQKREQHALQEDLKLALKRGEMSLHYQPQKKMSGETVGFEALVRWQCPKRGAVSPATFIPVAEESGLIGPLGEWVLREACREAASWPQPLSIAVNVSPMQFKTGDLPRLVHSILLETGLPPGRLELEITEGVLVDDFSRAEATLNQLKALGVHIAMDDFGTGYSSMSYLHAFPFDKIKIDRTFVRDLEHNRHSMAIVRAVIGLGRSLDLPILAEGVETKAQHEFLEREGCDEVQGYLTGRPLPIAAYSELVGLGPTATLDRAASG